MDETLATENEQSNPSEHEKMVAELENARRWLFDDEWVRELIQQTRERIAAISDPAEKSARESAIEVNIDPKTGLFDQKIRARNAFNNIMSVVPGAGGHWPDAEPVGVRTAGDFRRDFLEIAQEIGFDISEVERLNGDPPPMEGEDPEFKLNKFIFPIMEKMVKERGWKVIY